MGLWEEEVGKIFNLAVYLLGVHCIFCRNML